MKTTYDLVRQQLPAVEDLAAVLASHQIGIAQLAIEYCDALVEDTTCAAAMWPGFNFERRPVQAFDTVADRDLIIMPLLTGRWARAWQPAGRGRRSHWSSTT